MNSYTQNAYEPTVRLSAHERILDTFWKSFGNQPAFNPGDPLHSEYATKLAAAIDTHGFVLWARLNKKYGQKQVPGGADAELASRGYTIKLNIDTASIAEQIEGLTEAMTDILTTIGEKRDGELQINFTAGQITSLYTGSLKTYV